MAETELFEWTLDGEKIRETTSYRSQIRSGQTYAPAEIKRSAIEHGTGLDGAKAVTVTVPRSHEVAARFRAAPPGRASLEVYRLQGGTFVMVWSGRLVSVKWSGETAEIVAEPPQTMMKHRGLRQVYAPRCRHRLFDSRCNAIPALALPPVYDLWTDLVVAGIDGNVVTLTGLATFVSGATAASAAHGPTWFVGGEIITEPSGGLAILAGASRRAIASHEGDTVTLHEPPPLPLAVGATVRVVAGCGHDHKTCHEKFGNAERFGGFPYSPPKNPFDGELI